MVTPAHGDTVIGIPAAGHEVVSVEGDVTADRAAHTVNLGLALVTGCFEHGTPEPRLLRSVPGS
jgi:hypothetical protein